MNTTTSCPDGASAVLLKSQIALAKRFLNFPAEILREAQGCRLLNCLEPVQAQAIEAYFEMVRQAVTTLDNQANDAAMKTLLEPQDARHRVRAFFSHAKARAMEFGLTQFKAIAFHCEGSFADFINEVHCSQNGCQSSHRTQAAAQAQALRGQDPTTDEYAMARTEAACAQGREEAYSDLTDLFDLAMSVACQTI